jgi:hypothetical protein
MASAVVAGSLKVGIIPPAAAGRTPRNAPRPTAPPGPRAAAARAWRRGEGARRATGPRTRRAGRASSGVRPPMSWLPLGVDHLLDAGSTEPGFHRREQRNRVIHIFLNLPH